MTDFYKNYRVKINEINLKEKEINIELNKLKNAGKENTVATQEKTKKLLSEYNALYSALNEAYKGSNAPATFPQGEIDKRQKEIQVFKLNYDRMKKQFNEFENSKYQYNTEAFNQNYVQDPELSGKTDRELYQIQQEKKKEQDKKLDAINIEVKENIVIGQAINSEIREQNIKIEDLQEHIDEFDSRMTKVRKKFTNYMVKQNTCCMLIILIVEVALAILIYVLFS